MTTTFNASATVLVLGATGHLGGKVARLARARGLHVRALVRPGSSTEALERAGVEIAPGDLLDPPSLAAAARGCDAIVLTAIGYSNRKKGDLASGADTLGARNVAEAALAASVRRLVFCSVLTCDQAPDVPHFWNKKLAEDHFEARGVPFVSLRPGAFLDQGPSDFWAKGLRAGRLEFPVSADVRATFVHTEDVARSLVAAIDAPIPGRAARVDLGCDRPVSIAELARLMGEALGREVRPRVPPWPLVGAVLDAAGLFDPWKRDLKRMMAHIRSGRYVADTALQAACFGPPPRVEDAVRRYLAEIGLLAERGGA